MREKNYTVIEQINPGLGNAYLDGLKSTNDEYILTFSPDGNSDPVRLDEMVNSIKKIQILIYLSVRGIWNGQKVMTIVS